jgi:hypothetical protein
MLNKIGCSAMKAIYARPMAATALVGADKDDQRKSASRHEAHRRQ